jgi:MYXO-CTERM domain-containing protein
MMLLWLILIAGAISRAAVAAEPAPPWAGASDETGRTTANAPAQQPPNATSRGAAYPSTTPSATAPSQPAESVPSRPARAATKASAARHERQSAAAGASRNAEPLASTSGAAAADTRPVTSGEDHSADQAPWGLLGLLGLFGLAGLLRRRRSGYESVVRHERYDTPHSVRSGT